MEEPRVRGLGRGGGALLAGPGPPDHRLLAVLRPTTACVFNWLLVLFTGFHLAKERGSTPRYTGPPPPPPPGLVLVLYTAAETHELVKF